MSRRPASPQNQSEKRRLIEAVNAERKKGKSVAAVCKKLKISHVKYCQWSNELGVNNKELNLNAGRPVAKKKTSIFHWLVGLVKHTGPRR